MVDSDDQKRAVIRSVQGRSAGGERGRQKLSEITIEHPDGRIITGRGVRRGPHLKVASAMFVAEIRGGKPNICPICFGNDPDSKEHVPSRAFGGQVMTYTCTRCNNQLGSRTEASLQDWFDNALSVRLVRKLDQRPVSQSRVILMGTEDDELLLMPDDRAPGLDFEKVSNDPEGYLLEYSIPRLDEVSIGMLKSAYLAAVLHLGRVPQVASASEIRAELLAVVEAPTRADVTLGDHARRLRFFRTDNLPMGPPLGLYRAPGEHPEVHHLISLAGSMMVEWPFPEIDPGRIPPSAQSDPPAL